MKYTCPKCKGHKDKTAKLCHSCSGKGKKPVPFGSKHVGAKGYIYIKTPTGWRREHVVVMENKLGRPLYKNEEVHHLNGVKADNNIENLELWAKSQPSGQRVEDLVAWAKEILALYEKED